MKVSIGSNQLPHFLETAKTEEFFLGVAEGSPPKTGETTLQGFEGSHRSNFAPRPCR